MFLKTVRTIALVDAWDQALELLQKSKLPVDFFQVPEQLNDQSLGSSNYDVVYSFSIFTHLNESLFIRNIKKIVDFILQLDMMIFYIFLISEKPMARLL
jgi:hypothetical protein